MSVEPRPDATISVLAEARVQAERVLRAAIAEAEQIGLDASHAAAQMIAREQESYRARAAGILDQTMVDAERLVAHAREQATAIVIRADAGSGNHLGNLERHLVEREAVVSGRLAASERSSMDALEQTEVHAASLREAARHEAEAILLEARAEGDAMLADVERIRNDAEERLAAALAVAAERGRAAARSETEAELVDAQREAERLEAELGQLRERIEQVELDAVATAQEKAGVIVQQAKSIAATIAQDSQYSAGLRSETYVHIRAILDAWERTHAEMVVDGTLADVSVEGFDDASLRIPADDD